MDTLYAGYGQPAPATVLAPGHDQGLFDPQYAVASLQRGGAVVIPPPRGGRGRGGRRGGGRGRRQHNNAAGLKLLLVGVNECFARAAVQFLVPLEVGAIFCRLNGGLAY